MIWSGARARARREIRRAKRYREQYAGPCEGYDHGEFVRQWGCALAGAHLCEGPVEAAHIYPRARKLPDSWRHLVPLCRKAHRQFDVAMASSLDRARDEWRLDLKRLADWLAEGVEARAETGRWMTAWSDRCESLLRNGEEASE